IVLFSIINGTSVTWERTLRDGTPMTVVMKCDNGSARFERGGAEGSRTVIWDGPGKAMLVLKPAEKTYTKMTEAQLKEMKERTQARVAEMRAKVEKLPPADRARAEAMMAAMGEEKPAEWKFKPT